MAVQIDKGEAVGIASACPDDLDPDYYLARYPDLRQARIDPVKHWIEKGRAEGRIGRPPEPDAASHAAPDDLDPEFYLARYPDLRQAGIDPVKHWIETGRAEGRVGRLTLPARVLVRANEWWFHKLPHCVFVYFLASDATTLKEAVPPLVALLVTVSAVANYGNAINELFDRDEDAKVGRYNVATLLGGQVAGGIAAASAMLALLVSYVSGGVVAAALTAIALALPTLYSVPPVRLKERTLLGVAADALAAHLYPAILSLLFALSSEQLIWSHPGLTAAIMVWALLAGLRGILSHQVDTADRDMSAGLVTIVHAVGVERVTRLMLLIILPLEIASLIAACILAPTGLPFLVVVALYVWTVWAKQLTRQLSMDRGDLAHTQPFFDNAFYLSWAPVGIVVDRSFDAPELTALVPVVVFMFWKNIRHESVVLSGVARRLRSTAIVATGADAQAEPNMVSQSASLLAAACPDDLDPEYYLARYPDVRQAGIDPVWHWIERGRAEGRIGCPSEQDVECLETPDDLDPEYYLARYPDVRQAGIDPVWHWIERGRAEGRIGCPSKQDVECLETPDDLDPEYYLARYPDVRQAGIDPVWHWIERGRAEGRIGCPSEQDVERLETPDDLDPEYYLARYPDVRQAGIDPVRHWIERGRAEGRRGKTSFVVAGSASSSDPSKKTLVVVAHEASRTGAPILALNLVNELKSKCNVITVLLGGGPLVDAFTDRSQLCLRCLDRHPNDAMWLTRKAIELSQPDFALVNSAESWPALSELAKAGVPTVTLVHEFLSSIKISANAINEIMSASSEIVFSSPVTLEDAARLHKGWRLQQNMHVLPQGRCALFADPSDRQSESASFGQRISASTRLVIGIGKVDFRKGVDLFIQCAQRIVNDRSRRDVHFIWVGAGYAPLNDKQYSVYLKEQVERCGLTGVISFVGELSELERVYKSADLLLLTSRFDPLPNVAIDAICSGLPIVCFEHASGIASILSEEGLAETCVAPYADAAKMAGLALNILRDDDRKGQLGAQLEEIGRRRFDLATYVRAIMRLLDRARPARSGLETGKGTGTDAQLLVELGIGKAMDDVHSIAGGANGGSFKH